MGNGFPQHFTVDSGSSRTRFGLIPSMLGGVLPKAVLARQHRKRGCGLQGLLPRKTHPAYSALSNRGRRTSNAVRMNQSAIESSYRIAPVLSPSWRAILIAWIVFVVGSLALMIVISHPLFGGGILLGVALSILTHRVRAERAPTSPAANSRSRPVATDGGQIRDTGSSGSEGVKS